MTIWKRKSLWLSVLVLLALGGITAYVVWNELSSQDIVGTLQKANIWWVLAAALCTLIYFVAECTSDIRIDRLFDGFALFEHSDVLGE